MSEGVRVVDLGRLSPREKEIARLIGTGNTARQIAELLGRSVKTVETQRTTIKHKLGLRSAAETISALAREVAAGRL